MDYVESEEIKIGNNTWNQQIVKQKNKQLVLNLIILSTSISRADIANTLGLNKATVSSLVNELIEEELIIETGPGESSGGRRPVMLVFNNNAGYAVGVDIGVNYILGVITDLSGNVVEEERIEIDSIPFQEHISLVKKMIHHLIDQTPKSRYQIIGIGIGVPGIIDKKGNVLIAPNLGWQNINLMDVFKEEFNYPIFIENEANAGAYGEKRFGAGKDQENLIYVSLGIGIGVGIILNNQLYEGHKGFAGENGHMIISYHGEKCKCGNEGCWEAYASEYALIKQANKKGISQHPSLKELLHLAEDNDSVALEIFRQIGEYIGVGITNLIKTINPQKIIIGNRLATARKYIESPIQETVSNNNKWLSESLVQIVFSDLETHSAAIGAATFAIDGFLSTHSTIAK